MTRSINIIQQPDCYRTYNKKTHIERAASKKETLDLALTDLEKARQLKPGFGSIRKFQGFVLEELGRKEEGQAIREEAKSIYPTEAEDLYWLGVIAHFQEYDFFVAYAHFSQALLLAPNDYWIRLGKSLCPIPAEENVNQRVIPELEIAKTIRPDLPFASEFLAQSFSTNSLRRKRELAGQIERFGLDILRAHDMFAILQREKKHDEAEAILLKVLDQDIGGHTAELIGHSKYSVGRYEQACDWYRRAISEGANYDLVYHLGNYDPHIVPDAYSTKGLKK